MPLVLWWLLVTAAMVAITWACRHVSDAGLDWAGIEVRRVLPLVAVYVTVTVVGGFLYSGLHVAGHQFLVTRMYAEQRDPSRWQLSRTAEMADAPARRIAHFAILATLVLFVLALGGGWFVASRLDLKTTVAVTAHRGASVHAPENSLAAFRAALDAGATYVELDVQQTRDRRIVVLHDGDFMRMGGDPRKVSELTAAELTAIDIGRKYDAKFAGERAPMLDEVIELVRGKMKINVELKYNVPDADLAPAVIDLLRREHFLDQVVITSLDYAALQQVESIEPQLTTGHIVTAAVGNVVRTGADFLSLGSAQATRSLIRRAHAAGKEVHVWTVNKPEVMLRMIERGVDNIITDDPALLVRVIRERNALSTSEVLGLGLRVLFSRAPQELIDPEAVEPL
jgi:glycerophosphoryl diester phosphodiesterase